jgi:hypothetical protein
MKSMWLNGLVGFFSLISKDIHVIRFSTSAGFEDEDEDGTDGRDKPFDSALQEFSWMSSSPLRLFIDRIGIKETRVESHLLSRMWEDRYDRPIARTSGDLSPQIRERNWLRRWDGRAGTDGWGTGGSEG